MLLPPSRALVTGATGFLGRALCRALKSRGMFVRGAARHSSTGPWDEFVCFDLRHPELPLTLTRGVDTIFHLAARVHVLEEQDDDDYFRVNVEGTRRLLDAAECSGVARIVLFSSVKALGDGGEALVGDDSAAPPNTAYGRSKREAERLVLEGGTGRLHTAVLRPSLVYGPGWQGNLRRMFQAVRAGRFPPLPEMGNRRSMVHSEDVAAAAILAASRPLACGRTYILADGEAYSTRRVYEAMCHALGRPVPSWQVPARVLHMGAELGDFLRRHGAGSFPFDSAALHRLIGSAWYDSTRARRELGWEPSRTLEQALPEISRTPDQAMNQAAGR